LLKGDNMKDLIIVGAGNFAMELLDVVKSINNKKKRWNILGFIDDNEKALDGKICDYSIIGSISNWTPQENEVFALGIADPKIKEIVVNKLKPKNAHFETIIGVGATVGRYAVLGEGAVVLCFWVASYAIVGDFVTVMGGMIGEAAVIDDFCTITGFANIASGKLGKRVFVGSHAVVLKSATVGDDAIVGAGSIVVRNVKAGTTVFGNPAKRIY